MGSSHIVLFEPCKELQVFLHLIKENGVLVILYTCFMEVTSSNLYQVNDYSDWVFLCFLQSLSRQIQGWYLKISHDYLLLNSYLFKIHNDHPFSFNSL
jgi:hypothetical protein